ncbi:flagellar protein FlaG [Orenia marismortui]|uniref:flagellar protein FlaG n=1 Tax=Orenia marismortui TaxID=46469 RepID=UPI0003776AF2|nr:flagellar protein FlaG [Orenia marismortui]
MKISESSNIRSAVSINSNQSQKVEQLNNQEVKEEFQAQNNKQSKENVENSLKELNDAVQAVHKDLKFELHDESERMMVKVMDLDKHKVIKELPPEEVLDMVGKIKEMVGLIIDEKI